jgi:hypothetical protein
MISDTCLLCLPDRAFGRQHKIGIQKDGFQMLAEIYFDLRKFSESE